MAKEENVLMNSGRSWGQFFIVFLMGITVAMGMFKVPTNFPLILQTYGIEMSVAGFLMSVVGLSCIVTAIPAGLIMQKIGVKKFAYICMAAAIIENFVGAFAPNFGILLATRFLEAISYGCISMVSVAVITGNFTAEKRGLPNGIWVIWVSLANLIIPQVTTYVSPQFGFQGVWIVCGVVQVIMLLIFAIFVKEPPREESADGEKHSMLEAFKEPGAWLISLCTLGLAIGCGCYTGLYPTFLQLGLGFDMETANNVISISQIGGIVSSIAIGFIINAIAVRNRGFLMIVVSIISIICFAFAFHVPPELGIITAFATFFSAVAPINMPIAFAMAPDLLKRPELLSAALGIFMIGANVGGSLSMNIPSLMMEQAGGDWTAADPFILGFAVFGLVCAIAGTWYQRKKILAQKEQ